MKVRAKFECEREDIEFSWTPTGMSKINGVLELKWFMLICIKTVCLQYSGSSLTDRQPGFSIGFFTARSRSSPFSCMREEHALNDCIFCFVIVTSRFLGLHLESTRGGR